MNESLEKLGRSPVKSHGLKKCSRVPYANAKLQDTVSTLKTSFVTAFGIEESDLDDDAMVKSRELDSIMEQIKTKLVTASFPEKIQMLTLTPESWSRKFASNFFEVSEHLIRRAREVKQEKGILALPERKKRDGISSDVIDNVV